MKKVILMALAIVQVAFTWAFIVNSVPEGDTLEVTSVIIDLGTLGKIAGQLFQQFMNIL
jgi:hypothetical protein